MTLCSDALFRWHLQSCFIWCCLLFSTLIQCITIICCPLLWALAVLMYWFLDIPHPFMTSFAVVLHCCYGKNGKIRKDKKRRNLKCKYKLEDKHVKNNLSDSNLVLVEKCGRFFVVNNYNGFYQWQLTSDNDPFVWWTVLMVNSPVMNHL